MEKKKKKRVRVMANGISHFIGRCRHCGECFFLCKYNWPWQRYCTKPDCRAASRNASQAKWLSWNPGHFRGPWNVCRMQMCVRTGSNHVFRFIYHDIGARSGSGSRKGLRK